jgi:hypothetical protein
LPCGAVAAVLCAQLADKLELLQFTPFRKDPALTGAAPEVLRAHRNRLAPSPHRAGCAL